MRVLEIDLFVNSKRFFKTLRHRPHASVNPAAVHANYHPDKLARMRAVAAAFFEGDWGPAMALPGGSEPGS